MTYRISLRHLDLASVFNPDWILAAFGHR